MHGPYCPALSAIRPCLADEAPLSTPTPTSTARSSKSQSGRKQHSRTVRGWTMESPPLRYDVESLEHWLDLNA